MKDMIYRRIFLAATFLLTLGLGSLIGQTTIISGDWEANEIWDNEKSPGLTIGNSYSEDEITISEGHVVFIGSEENGKNIDISNNGLILNVEGKLNIYGNLEANNGFEINVINNGHLNIFGDVEVNNNLEIFVDDNAIMNVFGNIEMKNNAEIKVEGIILSNGIFGKGNNDITGGGIIYTNEIDDGVEYGDFQGYVVVGNTCLELPAPYNLELSNSASVVNLVWSHDYSDHDFKDLEFVGYQVFMNTSGRRHFDNIIADKIEDKEFTYTVDLEEYSGTENFEFYVRAVYTLKETKNESDFVFSPISNDVGVLNSQLPITLKTFNAFAENNEVRIEWTTASEENNDYFSIQRSSDAINFETIEIIEGAGFSNTDISYFTYDENPLQGVSYYRLKQTDYDGTYEIFHPVAVMFEAELNEPELDVFPNPAPGNDFQIQITTEAIDNTNVQVYSTDGIVVFSKNFENANYINIQGNEISGQLNPGTYFVVINNGEEKVSQRLLVF